MLVIGLTGSRGMGKSTCAAMFADNGVAVFDADATVHDLYRGTAAPLVEAAFPGTVVDSVVDREKLAGKVVGNASAIERLEKIVHPLVREAEERFRADAAQEGRRIILLDIPLLFEVGADNRVDVVILVSTTKEIQRQRALARPGMSEDRLDAILANQMPDEEKRLLAHIIIDTSGALVETRRQVEDIVKALAAVAAAR